MRFLIFIGIAIWANFMLWVVPRALNAQSSILNWFGFLFVALSVVGLVLYVREKDK